MAAAFTVYKFITGCTVGSTAIKGILSIAISQDATPITASADGDTYVPVVDRGVTSTGIQISLVDPGEADKMLGQSGTLAFTGTAATNSSGSSASVSCVNFVVLSVNSGYNHNSASSGSINGACYSSDGATDPVTVS